MGTHMRVLGESFQMNTHKTGFICFSRILVLWTKVARALDGLSTCDVGIYMSFIVFYPCECHQCYFRLSSIKAAVYVIELSDKRIKGSRLIFLKVLLWLVSIIRNFHSIV